MVGAEAEFLVLLQPLWFIEGGDEDLEDDFKGVIEVINSSSSLLSHEEVESRLCLVANMFDLRYFYLEISR